jgi:putative SOS response-associated peptidase YedK
MPVITNEAPNIVSLLNWGLIPFWVKDEKTALHIRLHTLNARGETVFNKPAFRHCVVNKRCLVLVTGFFEWRHFEGKKYPYYIRLRDNDPFALAGIWYR